MVWREFTGHLEVLYGALTALVVVVLLTPAVGGMARLLGVVDRTEEGRRSSPRGVPRLGGLALFLGIFVASLAFLPLGHEIRGILLGAAVATTVGAVDDFRGLRWWEKLGGQFGAAAIPTGGESRLLLASAPGADVRSGAVTVPPESVAIVEITSEG